MSPIFRIFATTAALVLALALAGYGLAASPLLAIGGVLGLALIGSTVAWPLVVIGVMLALGPVDVAFLTGGQRSLLPELGGVDMSGIRLIGISLGLGLVVLTRRDLLRSLAGPETRWYVLFLAWGAASLAFSPAPLDGLRLLLKLAYPLLVFVLVAAPERTAEETRRLVDWTLVGAAVILLMNPFVLLNGGYAIERGEFLRVAGPGSHFNPFSFYLLVVLLLSLARFRSRGQARYLLLATLSLIWMTLALTRITFLATLVAIGVAAIYAAVVDRSVRALVAMGALGTLVGGLLLVGVLERTFGYLPTPMQLLSLLANPTALYAAVNWQGREVLWAIMRVTFMQSPVFGSGLGAASDALRVTMGGGVPHNEYLRLAVDVGLVGCALYFLAVLGWIKAVARSARRIGGDRVGQEVILPALALFAGWAIIAITDNAFDYYGPLTQYVALLSAAAVVRAGALADGQQSPREGFRRGGALSPAATVTSGDGLCR